MTIYERPYKFGSTYKHPYERTYEFGSTYKRTYECTYQFLGTYKRSYKFWSTYKRSYVRFLAPGPYMLICTDITQEKKFSSTEPPEDQDEDQKLQRQQPEDGGDSGIKC